MSATNECIVCFMPLITGISCSEPSCMADCCHDCFSALVDHFAGEKMLPKCPNENCRGIFYLASVNKLGDKELLKRYVKATVRGLMVDNAEEAKKMTEEKQILKKLREERFAFIESKFPAAILLTAKITFSTKLKRMERDRMKNIISKIKASNRLCINTVCKGYLDENFVCTTCTTQFCKRCERPAGPNGPQGAPVSSPERPAGPNQEHICNENDVASIEAVKSMVKCPGCQLPVFKYVGCDFVTCANCRTNFNYITGKKAESGSQNKSLHMITDPKKLSSEFAPFLSKHQEVLNILLQIEALDFVSIESNGVITPLHHFLALPEDTEEAEVYAAELAVVKAFMKFTRRRVYSREYAISMIALDKIIRDAIDKEQSPPVEPFRMVLERLSVVG